MVQLAVLVLLVVLFEDFQLFLEFLPLVVLAETVTGHIFFWIDGFGSSFWAFSFFQVIED